MTNETKWSMDQAHSEIAFKVKHLMISNANGAFKKFNANIYTSDKDFTTAAIDLWIDTSSIATGDEKLDEHLRSADFFDVKNHKQITFISKGISKEVKDRTHELTGELTMKGITKKIKLNVEFGGIVKDPHGNEKAGFTVTGKINRNDWGIKWNTVLESGAVMVGEEVTITCDIELINASRKEMEMKMEHSTNHKGLTAQSAK